MATKIVTKNSSTASAVPTASDLVQGELAVNVADKRLFTEDNAGAIVELGTNPTTLTVTGEITANGGIALGDNDKATFGAGDDLQIYHDGSASYIKDLGTGPLAINTNGSEIMLTGQSGSEYMVRAIQDGAVELYYDASKKLSTTSTGIDVTGTIASSGNLEITSSVPKIILTDSNNPSGQMEMRGANTEFVFDFDPANAENNSQIDFKTDGSRRLLIKSTGIDVTGTATMDGLTVTGSDAALAASIGTAAQRVYITPSGTVINYNASGNSAGSHMFQTGNVSRLNIASNGDISFYEDTGTTPKFFWDASAESLGIGTSSPFFTTAGRSSLSVNGTSSSILAFGKGGSSENYILADAGGFTIANTSATLPTTFYTNGSERFRIASDGAATFSSSVRGTQLEAYKTNHGGDVSVAANQVGNAYENLASTASLILGATATSTINSTKIVADHSGGATNNHVQDLVFYPVGGNSQNFEAMRISSLGALTVKNVANGHTVFNENGVDADFRVESDSNTHMLFVDAGANHVGVGTPTPGHPLSIRHSDKADPQIHLETASYGSNYGVKILAASTNESGTVSSFSNIHKTTASINGRSDVLQHISFVSSTVANDFQKFNCGGSTQLTISGGGSVTVAGALSKGSGSFKIDHPLPAKTETHNLVHSFIEGPQADNIYRGKVTLVDGSATVNIDTVSGMSEGTYVLLNTNTQCFTSNESGWTAVKGSVAGNILTIEAQESCSDTISWMVVGERHDQHMLDTKWTDENGKVIVEPLKELES